MKKLLVVCLCLMFFVGCSDASAAVTNGNDTIVSVGGKKVTKEQIYEILRDQDAGETVLTLINNYIASKEVTLTSEIEAEAKAELATAIDDMGDSLDAFLDYYGYESTDAYYEKEVLPATLYSHLPEVYIQENWDAVVEYYFPTMARMLETTTSEAANAARAELMDGKSFDEVAKKYSTNSNAIYNGTEQLYSRNDSSTLSSYVVDFLRNAEGPTLSAVLSNDAADKFYIVQITEKNPNQYSEAAIADIKESTELDADMMAYYCKKYDLRIYDINLYNIFQDYYPTYLQD